MLKHSNEATRVEHYLINLENAESASQNYNETLCVAIDDAVVSGSCIKCAKPQCLEYYDEEYICSAIFDYAADTNRSVCSVGAIEWSNEKQEITVDANACIKCGLCISRCPFGAIYFEKTGNVTVNNNRSHYAYEVISCSDDAELLQNKCIHAIEGLTTDRKYRKVSKAALEGIYNAIEENNAFATLLCRNLLIQLLGNCATRRVGDVYTRMDAVFEHQDDVGVIEIEYERDTLSVARNLLDDLAMMQARYSINAEEITPVALCLEIPNTRQGYFQVCDDVAKVLQIEIRTLTIGALLILLWNGAKLDFKNGKFVLGFRNTSIKKAIEELTNRDLSFFNDDLGILDSKK